MQRGTAKVQFFSNYDYIKDLYYKRVFVVAKHLYELLKKEEIISMSYKQFNRYFQEFIFSKDERFFNSNIIQNKTVEQKVIDKAPKIKKIIVGEKKHKPYNPHTREINPKDIL
jgi:prolyl oligopeptidase PreP (S9A serine peptidase family)